MMANFPSRPGESRDPFLRLSEFSSNGNAHQPSPGFVPRKDGPRLAPGWRVKRRQTHQSRSERALDSRLRGNDGTRGHRPDELRTGPEAAPTTRVSGAVDERPSVLYEASMISASSYPMKTSRGSAAGPGG